MFIIFLVRLGGIMRLNKIRMQLKENNHYQNSVIAYRCLLRVFPLFYFFGKKNLYNLFYSIDLIRTAFFKSEIINKNHFINSVIDSLTKIKYEYKAYPASSAVNSVLHTLLAVKEISLEVPTSKLISHVFETIQSAYNSLSDTTSISGGTLSLFINEVENDIEFVLTSNLPNNIIYNDLWSNKNNDIIECEKKFRDYLLSFLEWDYWFDVYTQHINSDIDYSSYENRTNLTLEILNQGPDFVTNHLKRLSLSKSRINEIRIIFMGDGGSGKTSLIKRLFGESMNNNEESTTEISIRDLYFDNSKITTHLWDFGGQVMLHATHQLFLRERCIYVIVLDGRKEEDPEYWLDHVRIYGNSSPVFIVKNKCDKGCVKDIPFNKLKEKYNNIIDNISLSCANEVKWEKTIQSFYKKLGGFLYQNKDNNDLNPEIPLPYFNIKRELEKLRDEKDHLNQVNAYIDYTRFKKICSNNGITSEVERESLLAYFDTLGVLLKFDYGNEHILNPDWLSVAAYRIVRSQIVKDCKGILQYNDLSKILFKKHDDIFEYDKSNYRSLLEILKSFELLYFLNEVGSMDTQIQALVPSLLPDDQKSKKEIRNIFDRDSEGVLHFVYKFSFLPTSIMTRFITKIHNDIKNREFLWRHGVIIIEKNNQDNMSMIIEDVREKRIDVWVKGKDARGYLSYLRRVFKSILNTSFSNIYYRKEELYSELVPLGKNIKNKDEYISYDELLQKEIDGEITFTRTMIRVQDEININKTKPKIFNVQELLNGYSYKEERTQDIHVQNIGVLNMHKNNYSVEGSSNVNVGDNQKNTMRNVGNFSNFLKRNKFKAIVGSIITVVSISVTIVIRYTF